MSMEWNKIFGAVLLAGLIAMLAGFASKVLVHSKPLEKSVYVVATPEGASAPADKGAAPTGPAPIAPLLAAASPDAGQKVAKACATASTRAVRPRSARTCTASSAARRATCRASVIPMRW